MWNAPITTLVKVYEECIYAKVKKVAISASLLGLLPPISITAANQIII